MPRKTNAAVDRDDLRSVAADVELQHLRGQLADMTSQYKSVCRELKECDDRLSAILGVKDQVGHAPAKFVVKTDSRASEAVAFMVTSDWHLEEKVDPRTVDGLNEYNPSIAEARIAKFFNGSLSLVDMCRAKSRIDTGVLMMLGDHITNIIHDDLAESNYMSPTEAVITALRLAKGGIDFLLANGSFKKLIVVCNFGNHGRTTRFMRVATAAKHSYEWMMYHLLAEHYRSDSRVRFVIADGITAASRARRSRGECSRSTCTESRRRRRRARNDRPSRHPAENGLRLRAVVRARYLPAVGRLTAEGSRLRIASNGRRHGPDCGRKLAQAPWLLRPVRFDDSRGPAATDQRRASGVDADHGPGRRALRGGPGSRARRRDVP